MCCIHFNSDIIHYTMKTMRIIVGGLFSRVNGDLCNTTLNFRFSQQVSLYNMSVLPLTLITSTVIIFLQRSFFVYIIFSGGYLQCYAAHRQVSLHVFPLRKLSHNHLLNRFYCNRRQILKIIFAFFVLKIYILSHEITTSGFIALSWVKG